MFWAYNNRGLSWTFIYDDTDESVEYVSNESLKKASISIAGQLEYDKLDPYMCQVISSLRGSSSEIPVVKYKLGNYCGNALVITSGFLFVNDRLFYTVRFYDVNGSPVSVNFKSSISTIIGSNPFINGGIALEIPSKMFESLIQICNPDAENYEMLFKVFGELFRENLGMIVNGFSYCGFELLSMGQW